MSSQFINFLDDMDLLMPSSSSSSSNNNHEHYQQQSGDLNANAAIMSTLIMPSNFYQTQTAAAGGGNTTTTQATSNYLFNSNPNLSSTYGNKYQYGGGQHPSNQSNESCWSAGQNDTMDTCFLSHSMDPLILMESTESSQAPSPPANSQLLDNMVDLFEPLPSINTLSIRNTDHQYTATTRLDQQQQQHTPRPFLQKSSDSLAQYFAASPANVAQMNMVIDRQDLAISGGQQFMVNQVPLEQQLAPAQNRYDFASNHHHHHHHQLRQAHSQPPPPAPLVSQQSLPILLHPTSMRPSAVADYDESGRTVSQVNSHNNKPVDTSTSIMSPSISSVSSCSSFSSYSAVSSSSSASSSAATKPGGGGGGGLTPRLDQLTHRPPRPSSQQPSFAHRSSLPLPLFSNARTDDRLPPPQSAYRSSTVNNSSRPNSIQQYDSSLLAFDRIDFTTDNNTHLASASSDHQYRDECGQTTTRPDNSSSISQPDEFQIDDFNLPTPTTDDKSLISHSSLSTPPPVFTSSTSSRSIQDPFDDLATPSSSSSKLNLPLLDQLNLSSTNNNNNNSYNNFLLNSSFTPATYITNSATGQLGFVSRSNSQPDLTLNLESRLQPIQPNSTFADSSSYANSGGYYHHYSMNQSMMNKSKGGISRHPSLTCKTSISEFDNDDFFNTFNIFDYLNAASTSSSSSSSSQQTSAGNQANNATTSASTNHNNSTATGDSNRASGSSNAVVQDKQLPLFKNNAATAAYEDDNIFLGTDAISDFLNNCGTFSELLDNLPDLEDYMSLVTFETSNTTQSNHQPAKQTLCDLALPSSSSSSSNTNGASGMMLACFNYADDDSRVGCSERNDRNKHINGSNQSEDGGNFERVTRSAPPSPTPQRKKQRPTGNNLPWQKAWSKMDDEEQSKIVEFLTKIINDEMGFREQLEIIRILNSDVKLKPADTQFIIDLKMIDDEKFRRIKEVIKLYGLSLNEKPLKDNSSDCSANSCPQDYQLLKRELRLKRAQQRLKLKQKKDHRQTVKESKSGLFNKTEVVPLSQVLPEEDIDIDVLS